MLVLRPRLGTKPPFPILFGELAPHPRRLCTRASLTPTQIYFSSFHNPSLLLSGSCHYAISWLKI